MPASRTPTGLPCPALLTRLIHGGPWQAKAIPQNNLRQQCRRLACFFRQPVPQVVSLRAASVRLFTAVAQKTRLLTDLHPDTWDATAVLTRLAWYQAWWLKAPETWQPDGSAGLADQWRSLVRHLFAAWPVPEFLESAWLSYGRLENLERTWYCHLARGGRLRTAPGMPASVTSRSLHLAMQCSRETPVFHAIRIGQLQACGAAAGLREEVLASPMVSDFSNEAVWSVLMQKVAGARPLVPGTFRMIADTLSGIIRREGLPRAIQLSRIPLGELYRYSVRWWQEMADSVMATGWDLQKLDVFRPSCRADLLGLVSAIWPALGGVVSDYRIHDSLPGRGIWSFHELGSQIQLLLEGRYMKHCVASYRKKCESGVSVIFSLRYKDHEQSGTLPERRLTLEILREKRRIVQIRGKWNRGPTEAERSLIAGWASRNQLTLAA